MMSFNKIYTFGSIKRIFVDEDMRYAAAIALIAIGALLWLFIGLASQKMEGRLHTRQVKARQVKLLAARLAPKKSGARGMHGTGRKGQAITSLLGWLEKQVKGAALESHLTQISPVEPAAGESFREKAMLAFKDVDMIQLLRFIERLENNDTIVIVQSDIERQTGPGGGVSFNCLVGTQ